MTLSEIRAKFLKYFEDKEHKIVESDLLVPKNDPTLLFTGAGMNQFKEQFMGRNITYSRAATSQKCLRTADLDNVGKTPRHHTFFEMLGNFSFGDYFKKEAIAWAWEFMTKEVSIPEEKLWISVYEDDEESYLIWRDDIKIPEGRIVKLGAHDNFWPADAPEKGPNGPCGPCSEIFYDWGESIGCGKKDCTPACDCGRFVEVWNLVFTEFERKPDGSLVPLPNKNIDTGMGLERIASVLQGVNTNFKTDLFAPIVEAIKKELGPLREKVPIEGMYLIADHLRAAVFTIADGVSPSNEKRGYVVRKLIRRAYLKSTKGEPFLYNIVPKITSLMKDVYPEVEDKREHISAIVEEEEKRFSDTLKSALPIFKDMTAGDVKRLEGEKIFKLVDTYGLPIDVIILEAEEEGISLDTEGFERLMDQRKKESRQGSDITSDFIFQPDEFSNAPVPEFSADAPLEAEVVFIVKQGGESDFVAEGESAEIVTSPQSSNFYAEAGGQVGDRGSIKKDGTFLEVVNTYKTGGRIVFKAVAEEGSLKKGDKVLIHLGVDHKSNTAKNHTATHLLQAALREVLGDHIKQSGSYVDDKRLRFDFTHMKKLTDRELQKVEDLVNEWVQEAIEVSKETKSIKEAKAEGALSFFGEKYGDTVRVVGVGDRSKEFCGGTHVDNTEDIGIVKITHETSIASGIRRIEAVTGGNVQKWVEENAKELLESITSGESGISKDVLDAAKKLASGEESVTREVLNDFEERIKPALVKAHEDIAKAAKKKEKQAKADSFGQLRKELEEMLKSPEKIGDINFLTNVFQDLDMGELRKAAGYLEKKVQKGIVLVGSSLDGKASIICAVTEDLIDKGIDAKEIVSSASSAIGGSGGGRNTFAQAGGKSPDGLEKAMQEAKSFIEKKIS